MTEATPPGLVQEHRGSTMPARLVRWFLFNVAVSLVPLGFVLLQRATDNLPVSIKDVTSRGELLLVSCALAAAAIGDLITARIGTAVLRILSGAGCVLTLLSAALYYTHVSSSRALNVDVVFATSVWLFVLCLLSSAACTALSGGQE